MKAIVAGCKHANAIVSSKVYLNMEKVTLFFFKSERGKISMCIESGGQQKRIDIMYITPFLNMEKNDERVISEAVECFFNVVAEFMNDEEKDVLYLDDAVKQFEKTHKKYREA